MNEEKNIITLDFASTNIPLPIESRNSSDTTYVNWGINNDYPSFLIGLYSQSAIHSAIVNQKTNYIIGDSLKLANKADLDLEINAVDNIKEFTSKVIKDYLLFNSFAVEVIFNVFGEPVEFYHIPMQKIRMNKSKSKFWFCDDWLLTRKYIQYDRYSVKNNQDSTSKIFYYDGYFPSIRNTYTTPDYAGTINSIVTDVAIKNFNLNNIKNHFSPSTIITFFNGANVTEAVKKQIINDIDTKFKGENGGKFIIDFQTKDGKSAEINQLSANDWDKAYIQVTENNLADILIGHQVQNAELFAIQVAGKLGNSQDLEVSYEIFKSNYITVKRDEIETALNQLFTNFKPINGKVKFADKPLFNTQLKDEVKLKIYTINELRSESGLPALPDGNRLLQDAIPQVQIAPKSEPVAQAEAEKKKSLTEGDYELIHHLGSNIEDFEEVLESMQFDKESDIAKAVIENDIKGLTSQELVDVLDKEHGIKTNVKDIISILDKMHTAGLIDVDVDDKGRIKVTPYPKPDVPDSDKILTMYKYIKRDEVDGNDLIPTSRSFCVKIIENKKLYSREDIATMSSIFGYDVFQYCGGFYYNPDTDETTSYCRHQWQQMKVKRKA